MDALNRGTANFVTKLPKYISGPPGSMHAALKDSVAQQQKRNAARQLQAAHNDLRRTPGQRAARLEAGNKEFRAFAYSASHALRAPPRSIDGFSKIVLDEYSALLQKKAQRCLRLVRSNAQKTGHLIKDLLAFSQLGWRELRKRTVDVTVMVKDVLGDFAADRAGRDISIEIGELRSCDADAKLLRLVLANLVGNGIKYTSERTHAAIRIGCRKRAEDAGPTIYLVQDNGVGFDMRYADKLFRVFQRLHRAEDYAGAGVGLAIAHRIVERHGGRLWAEAHVEHGATFLFTIETGVSHD